MKIVLINHSDSLGGASVVTRRLTHALRELGHEATMLVGYKSSDDTFVVQATSRKRTRIPFYLEAARIFASNGFNRADLFKVSLASDGLPLSENKLVKEADAIILAWVNQGILSFNEIKRIASLGKPVMWIMHDMWNCTGICHHAGSCSYFADSYCHNCHLLHAQAGKNDMAAKTWRHKANLYSNTDIRFVAVSSWLENQCRKSNLFNGQRLYTVPNPFPVDDFIYEPTASREELQLPQGKIILMAAARLDDPIKGLPLAIETLNEVQKHNNDAVAVFVGDIRNPENLTQLKMPYAHLGMISDQARIKQIFAHAHIVLSTSQYETLPGTLIEGQAAGAFPVATDRGGQRDIITCPSEGLLAPYGDKNALSKQILKALAQNHNRQTLHNITKRFSAKTIATQIITILKQ